MNDKQLLLIVLIAVVIYTIIVGMHVRKIKAEINATVGLLGNGLERQKSITNELTKAIDVLIYHFEQTLEMRIRKRELLDGTTKIYYNNEYSNIVDSQEMTEEEVKNSKQVIATQMIEDILNGKEDVI